ncbi:MAG: SLATT domain-containing protein [Ferruginibacter sp.]
MELPNASLQQPQKTTDIEIPVLRIQEYRWDTPEEIQKSVYGLYQYAESGAISSISWYGKNKKSKARFSRTLRASAIILTTLGGLTPIISSMGGLTVKLMDDKLTLYIGQLGYLFLGLAASCIAFDRFFGFSSGWMRYISTKMTLERALSEFRLDWAMMLAKLGNNPPNTEQVQHMIRRLKDFLVLINNNVEQETLTWVAEFKTNLAEIEKTAKTQSAASRPGAIAVTLTNGMETEDGFTVTLDGMDIRVVHGTKYQVGYVPPGTHKVSVRGRINGEILDASELVNVAAGEMAAVTLALPVAQAQP